MLGKKKLAEQNKSGNTEMRREMETIKNYLETMFAKLPDTQEVRKARAELWQMMEDKYMELINEGKAENEAIGTVIAEFGNIDELAGDLGIKAAVSSESFGKARRVTLDDAKGYLRAKMYEGYAVGFGVLLCIVSCCGFVAGLSDFASVGIMFVAIAAAVGLFVFSGLVMGRWSYIKKEACSISAETREYVRGKRESFRAESAVMIAIGVILCIVSVVPIIVADELGLNEGYALVIMFFAIGIGVLLFVAAGVRSKSYKVVLLLGGDEAVNGVYEPIEKKKVYKNEKVEAVMSVYWLSVTCIYLIWSFLTFDWHITWIVWVVAALAEKIIESVYVEH